MFVFVEMTLQVRCAIVVSSTLLLLIDFLLDLFVVVFTDDTCCPLFDRLGFGRLKL